MGTCKYVSAVIVVAVCSVLIVLKLEEKPEITTTKILAPLWECIVEIAIPIFIETCVIFSAVYLIFSGFFKIHPIFFLRSFKYLVKAGEPIKFGVRCAVV